MTKKIIVLIGNGGRLPIIFKVCKEYSELDLTAVFSHKRHSDGIRWIKKEKISAFYFRLTDWRKQNKGSREEYDKALAKKIKKYNPDLIICAGWDLIFSSNFINPFKGKIWNIHPAYLTSGPDKKVKLPSGEITPVFRGGTAVEEQIKAYKQGKIKNGGCTLHMMTEEVDIGLIIKVCEVPISPIETFTERIHKKEEEILKKALINFAKK